MTQEEKIEEAKKLYKDANADQRYVLEKLFPELKESEDEKIKREIIEYIKTGTYHKEWIAWLEKRSTLQVRTGLEWVNTIDDACDKRYSEEYADGEYCHEQSFKWGFQEGVEWLEKQGEKEYTFKSLSRLLDMIEPTREAKAYCQKLIDTLVKEGYSTDAKIVGECLKKMNGEDVPMAIMDEKKGEPIEVNPTEFDLRLNRLLKQFESLSKEELASSLNFYLNVVQNDGTYKDEEKQSKQKSFDYENANIQQKDFAPKVEPKFKVGDKIIEKDFDECSCGTIINIKDGKYIFDNGGFLNIEEQGLWQLVEQKSAWSKEDEDMIEILVAIFEVNYSNDFYKVNPIGTTNMQAIHSSEIIKWLNSLKERVQSQKIAYYNPYKEIVESIAEMCKHYDKETDLQDFYDNVKVKCKDAKEYDSLFLQNTWKPSKEQVIALRWVLNNIPYNKHKEEISGLLDQINKLREE